MREGSETGTVVLDETFSDQLLHQHKLDVANQLSNLGEPVPQPFLPGWWVAVIGNAQPVNHYYYKVQACAGSECGEFSDWAEWLETIPWPF